MRAVVQRVEHAEVTVAGQIVGRIGSGLCVLVGVGKDDGEGDAELLAKKIAGLRIFDDVAGRMNRDVKEIGGAVLAVSQFTLLGDARKGKRPSYSDAMDPERAHELFERFCSDARALGLRVETGQFRSRMRVALTNDGPVTILVDTKRLF